MVPALSSVVHVTSWISRQGGGIPPVIWSQAREFTRLGKRTSVAGLADEFVKEDCEPLGIPFVAGQIMGPRTFGFSPTLRTLLNQNLAPRAVVHSHGLWMYPGTLARQLARRAACPLVISPHGMLEPWALKNSGWKKLLAARLYEDHNLRSAQCLHALCEPEARDLRSYGLRNPIAIIPNGIAVEGFRPLKDYHALETVLPSTHKKKRMLFLSRIHPKKGLLHLLQAWQKIAPDFDDWILIVAGNDQLGHLQQLLTLSRQLGIEKSVFFPGPVFGEIKKTVLSGADAFVLPSLSEGFSVAVLEAAACGLPVLLTPQCNFPELIAAKGALVAQPESESIATGLREMLSMSDEQRREMGGQARALVERDYTWKRITERMADVYSWLVGNSPAPDWVRFN